VEWNVQTYAVRLATCNSQMRDAVMEKMLGRGIATRPGVMTIHRQPAYADRGVSLPISELASDSSLMIPLHSAMTVSDVQEVAHELLLCLDDSE
jgi:perosamine synthetase